MKFVTPDGAVLAYWSALEHASAAKSPSMGQAGREYAFRCANRKCRRTKHHSTVGRMGALIERCVRCGAPWNWVEAYTLAGQTGGGRVGRAPAKLERLGELGSLVYALENALEIDPGGADLYLAWLGVGSKTREDLARDATSISLAGRDVWTFRDVRRVISQARTWLTFELKRRGMLDETYTPEPRAVSDERNRGIAKRMREA